MSIVAEHELGWVISHQKYFSYIQIPSLCENDSELLSLDPNLFNINIPFIRKRKDSTTLKENSQNVANVEQIFVKLLEGITSTDKNIFLNKDCIESEQSKNKNVEARTVAVQFMEYIKDHSEMKLVFNGSNTYSNYVISELHGHKFLFPPNVRFYCGNICDVLKKHFSNDSLLERNIHQFDLVVIDPPWKNKFVWRVNKKRKKEGGGYFLEENCEIRDIPLEIILAPGALVVVWCTNAIAHQEYLLNHIFPKWKLDFLGKWYWIKVTKYGDTICPFNHDLTKKQPYEPIFLGKYRDSIHSHPPHHTTVNSNVSEQMDLKIMKLLISVPSSIHSHKPPLIEILRKYLPSDPKCCELYARYLIPGFTSIGDEVIKLQNLSLYKT